MKPKCILTVDGNPVAGVFWEKLVSLTVNDLEGTKSDTIEMTLEDGPPHLAIPREKAIIQCWLGYVDGDGLDSGMDYMGAFTADDVEVGCLPWTMKISGKAADMRGKLKEHKERHWDNQTFGGVVGEMAKEAGLTAQVAPSLANFKGKDGYFSQQNESALHWIERQADRIGGLYKIADGKLIVAERGKGSSPLGSLMGMVTVRPEHIIKGSCNVSFGQREKHKDVEAEYHDTGTGKREKVKAPSDPDGEATYRMRHAFANKDEAERAAKSRGEILRRQAVRTSVNVEGRSSIKGGAPMTYAGGVRPGVDGQQFIIESAGHNFSRAGYTTAISATAK